MCVPLSNEVHQVPAFALIVYSVSQHNVPLTVRFLCLVTRMCKRCNIGAVTDWENTGEEKKFTRGGKECLTSVSAVCRGQTQAAVQVAEGTQQARRVGRLQPSCYIIH